MNPELLATLRKWQASDDPVQRRHAEWRLSVTDQQLADAARAARLVPCNEAIAALALVMACPYRSTTGCGCSGARCALRGAIVNHRDCLECVQRYGY